MMTNYNERLDEILTEYATRYFQLLRTNAPRELEEAKRIEAKQSLISLTKELVAEAKPEKKSTEDYGSWEEGHRNAGWNNCLEHYEHNLLKALEEV